MVFCNVNTVFVVSYFFIVTILILVDGFLQWTDKLFIGVSLNCHNPYFSRWFSAIISTVNIAKPHQKVTILILVDGFLQ